MRILRILFLFAGLALLGVILFQIDLEAVGQQVREIGWRVLWILAVFFAAFLADTLSWQLVLKRARLNLRWLYTIWRIRMVGSAYNQIIPFIGKGGEPIKVILLRERCKIGYREGAVSLIIAETINMLSLVLFTAGGLLVAIRYDVLPSRYHPAAWIGLVAFSTGIGILYLLQRLKLTSAVGSWLGRKWARLQKVRLLQHIRDMDEQLAGFYAESRGRFAAAFFLGFSHSVLGAVETYLTFSFLQHPITPAEAWAIAAVVELIRIGVFFIPSGIGAQEGALVLVTAHITGQPTLGFSLALVRRFRELVWILWGLLIGWRFSLTPGKASRLVATEETLGG
jgi:hypothetical protein